MIIPNGISPVGSIAPDLTLNQINTATTEEKTGGAFEEALAGALSIFNATNEDQIAADAAQTDFATGKNNDMLKVIMAEQKAATSLQLTVQLTNKVIEAYREIMRIQL